MKESYLLITFVMTCLVVAAQPDYAVHHIPDSLKENASIAVRDITQHTEILSQTSLVYTNKTVKTYFSAKDNSISLSVWYDDSRKLKSLKGFIYDANGKVVKKISKKDFDDYSGTGGDLAGDDRVKICRYKALQFPITTELSYEIETDNTAFLKDWKAFTYQGYGIAIQNNSYSISCPNKLGLRYLEQNFATYPILKKETPNSISYQIQNQKAILKEAYSPPIQSLAPMVIFALNKFHLEGVEGEASNWSELGKWYYDNLLKTQNELPAEAIAAVKKLTEGISDPMEKARKVYEFVQERSRYISIQLGIGGWKPFAASEVHDLGYGDCKGLTNYTMSLLQAIDITAYYCVVYGSRKPQSIQSDFASMEGNHVILCVPNPTTQEPNWLECTSQSSPFGYLGKFTDNRTVFKVSSSGGEILTTKKYDAADSKTTTKAEITLQKDGAANFGITKKSAGIHYNRMYITEWDEADKKSFYHRAFDGINGLTIESMDFENDKKNIVFTEKIKLSATDFVVQAGDDLLLSLLPFSAVMATPDKYRDRQTPFEILRGETHEDELTFRLPDGFALDAAPENMAIDNEFGTYTTNATISGQDLIVKRIFALKKGRFPKEKYKTFRAFIKKINKLEGEKVLLLGK